MTVDLRYIGTLARKQDGNVNLNTPNVYHNPELLQALNDARAGKDPILLDQLLAGLNLNNTITGPTGFAAVGTKNGAGVYQTGAAQLRKSATFASNLANGDFNAIATSLISLAPTAAQGVQALPNDPNTGAALTGVGSMRTLRNGCDRLANGAQFVQFISIAGHCPADSGGKHNGHLRLGQIDATGDERRGVCLLGSIQQRSRFRPRT
jgi:hypothetical protein